MNEKRPTIITVIGDLFILAAMFSIGATIFPNYFEKLGFHMIQLYIYSNRVLNIFLSIILIIVSAGFLGLKKWGYWLMIIYNIFFLIVNVIWCLQNKRVPFSFSILFIPIILINIISNKKYFRV